MIRIQWTTQSFIEKASLIHSNKYNYDKVEYINNKTKVKIACSIHGEFQQTPLLHIGQQTQGCPKCGIIQRSSKNRRTTAQFIEESKAIHGDRYDYSKSDYRSRSKKLTIICSLHGEFQLTPEHHFRKVGCAKCGTERSANANRITQEQYIIQANSTHNNRYDYSKVHYLNINTNIIIICSIHGEFSQLANNHVQGSGCPSCGVNNRTILLTHTTNDFIEKANIIHKNKYDYSSVEYSGIRTYVTIICPIHGSFIQNAGCHLQGCGCTLCGYHKNAILSRNTLEEFIGKSIQVHGDKYDYTCALYTTTHKYVVIICKIHGSFQQTPHSHMGGSGCPHCANAQHIGRISKISMEWINMIKVNHPLLQTEFQIPNTKYYADAFDPNTNTIYEFYGDYWHGNPKRYAPHIVNINTKCTMGELYERTMLRKNKCIELGYKYIEIWESQWTKFKSIIRERQRITRQ